MSAFLRTAGILLVASVALVAADKTRPAPATVTQIAGEHPDGSTRYKDIQVFVHSHNLDQLLYSLDDRGDQKQPMNADLVADVHYDRARDGNYLRAEGFYRSGRWESAAQFYAEAVPAADYEWVRIDAALKRGECLIKAKRYDEAVAAIDQMLAAYPRSARMPEAMHLKGEALAQAGKRDEGLKVFGRLASEAKGLKGRMAAEAFALAALGTAAVLSQQGEHGKAADELQRALGRVDRSQSPRQYVRVALELGEAQADAGQDAAALDTFDDLRFLPVAPELQGRAHLGMARILEAQGKKVPAFDAAVYAMLRGSSDAVVVGQARKLVRSIGTDLSKDESLSEDDRKQYLGYLSKL